MIDRKINFCDHPKADGLVERMVQMLKKGLQKYG
jgi:hypothetical protein